MEITSSLPAFSLKYYLSAKGWVSDLEFFALENTFMNSLLDDYLLRLSDVIAIEKLKQIGKSLTKLLDDNYYSDTVLNEQFENLTRSGIKDDPENIAELASKQMEMEYLIKNLNCEYRKVKIEF
jgi:hypothetical protein